MGVIREHVTDDAESDVGNTERLDISSVRTRVLSMLCDDLALSEGPDPDGAHGNSAFVMCTMFEALRDHPDVPVWDRESGRLRRRRDCPDGLPPTKGITNNRVIAARNDLLIRWWARRVVDEAPPLSEIQRARLRRLLRPRT
jgi:hypothetical protein